MSQATWLLSADDLLASSHLVLWLDSASQPRIHVIVQVSEHDLFGVSSAARCLHRLLP